MPRISTTPLPGDEAIVVVDAAAVEENWRTAPALLRFRLELTPGTPNARSDSGLGFLLTAMLRMGKEAVMWDARVEALSKVPLFSDLSARQLRKVLKTSTEDRYDEGTVIIRQDGRTQTMFVILEGTARVVRNGRTIGRRSEGDFFGELSVIDGRPRAGTVIAETPMRCVVILGEHLKEIVMSEPQAAWAMLKALASRVREK